MKIKKKNKFAQLFCKHDYQTGILRKPNEPMFFNISGDTVTTVCAKCGKVKDSTFIRNRDDS